MWNIINSSYVNIIKGFVTPNEIDPYLFILKKPFKGTAKQIDKF